jgi:hypothetical protein
LFQALGGGVLIGTAAVLLLWSTGRIAGVSSVAGNLIFSKAGDRLWRVLFLLGLVAGAAIYYTVYGNAPVARHDFPAGLLAAAGLLVGFGTSLGRGCTSGHGVCGLGRLSKRSLAATITFLSIGIATAVIARHAVGVA